METEKKITNDILVLEYIIKVTKTSGAFHVGNIGIASATRLTTSQVSTAIKKLSALEWFNKTNKARLTERGFSGTTRTITINLEQANNYLNK